MSIDWGAHLVHRDNSNWRVVLVAALFGILIPQPAQASLELKTGKDEQARLPFWDVSNKYMSLRLIQRLPDQTRGFYQARGFTPQQSEYIAQACVFQTIFKNISHLTKPGPLDYDLRQWRVIVDGKKLSMKTREDWRPFWNKQGASAAAKLAFEWSLLPTVQKYRAGDYNWGISVFGPKPGQRFILQLSWQQHGRTHNFTIKNIQCAPDIHPDPEEFERE